MNKTYTLSHVHITFLLLGLGVASLCGCASNGTASAISLTSRTAATAGLSGNVHGGQQPVTGSTIQLYAVGMTGYTSAATPLLTKSVVSDSFGNFSITGDYSCPSGSYVYLTASGGNPGLAAGTNNPNLTLMSALGSCSSLLASGAGRFIVLNEVSTVAGAYALAQFASGTRYGTLLSAQPGSYSSAPADNFATSSTNMIGLTNAFGMASVLADPGTGTSPGSNGVGGTLAEYWQVNTIADILAACVNTTGGIANDGSACGTLFANVAVNAGTSPVTSQNYATPVDTLQAALYLAQNPGLSQVPGGAIQNLYALILPTAPFVPYATASTSSTASPITDFTIAVQVNPIIPGTATTVLVQPYALQIDGNGNVWADNQLNSGTYAENFVEFSPLGVAIRAGTTSGNAPANYQVNSYVLNGASTATTIAGFYSSANNNSNATNQFSIDTNNNVWFPDRSGNAIGYIKGSGATGFSGASNGGNANDLGGSGATAYPLAAGAYPVSLAIDGNNDVFFNLSGGSHGSCVPGAYNASSLAYYTSGSGVIAGGNFSTAYYTGVFANQNNGFAMSIEGAGNPADVTTNGGVTTAIPGVPFMWTLENSAGNKAGPGGQYFNLISQSYAGSTLTPSNTTQQQGCATPINGTGPTASGAQTLVPTVTTGGDTYNAWNNATWIGNDHLGNIWASSYGFIDSGLTTKAAMSKVTPAYGSVFTGASAGPGFTFTNYHAVGGMTDTGSNYVRTFSIDGGGNLWMAMSSGTIGAMTGNGSSINQPSTLGFFGSVVYKGTVLQQGRGQGSPKTPVVDQSGNVWIPQNYTGSTGVLVLVGAGAPTVQPYSVGVGNGTLATRP